MKKYFISLCFLMVAYNSFGQKVKVGDMAPPILFQTSFPQNYVIPKGKPMLLDFWATWCGPCVAGLIKTNNLADKYSDKIEFIAITDQSSSNVEDMIKRRGFQHKFIIESSGKPTHEAFGVTGIPILMLIDEEGIIRWTGTHVDTDMIDNFLSGAPIEKTPHLNNSELKEKATIVASKKLPAKESTLIINERPVPDFEYTSSINLTPDTSHVIINYTGFEEILKMLSNDRIIIHNSVADIVKKRISIQYFTNFMPNNYKSFLINCIENMYELSAKVQEIDTVVWYISVVDQEKLSKHKTVMTNKYTSTGNGAYIDAVGKTETFTSLGISVAQLAKSTENGFNIICESDIKDETSYDFIEVNCQNIDTMSKDLNNKYGLELKSLKRKIRFLVVWNKRKNV